MRLAYVLDVAGVKSFYVKDKVAYTFENGEQRCFDMRAYMNQKPWRRLKSDGSFLAACVENGTVAWPGNIDI